METLDVELQELAQGSGGSAVVPPSLEMIKHVKVDLRVSVGNASISVDELFSLKAGDLLPLDRGVDEPVDVFLNGELVARGILASQGDSLGVRVTEINNPKPGE
ncbi:FliM/FliN family flagellar motor C-terminal domain-containing protein [Microbulbifer sp. SAOS-129_SWC]|uniref:FliM/FliN family flagellar motor C-terminal domain-containing protein n=1 Tax=Microbulbifer sp. SAOS-129_SWC TaxID=3145235 RepID=UPI0032168F80